MHIYSQLSVSIVSIRVLPLVLARIIHYRYSRYHSGVSIHTIDMHEFIIMFQHWGIITILYYRDCRYYSQYTDALNPYTRNQETRSNAHMTRSYQTRALPCISKSSFPLQEAIAVQNAMTHSFLVCGYIQEKTVPSISYVSSTRQQYSFNTLSLNVQ